MRRMMMTVALMGLVVAGAFAQSASDDPAVQQAKEETAVVFDLGRVFGYIQTMETEEPSLALSQEQVRSLYTIMMEIRQTDRIEPDQADDWLLAIEDEILTAKQLMYVDQLYLNRSTSSGTGEGTGAGSGNSASGTATGSISTYLAGGKFNPIMDATKKMGQDFAAYYQELAGRR